MVICWRYHRYQVRFHHHNSAPLFESCGDRYEHPECVAAFFDIDCIGPTRKFDYDDTGRWINAEKLAVKPYREIAAVLVARHPPLVAVEAIREIENLGIF